MAAVCPPRRQCRAVAADGREEGAEKAKAKDSTQRRKGAKTQREMQGIFNTETQRRKRNTVKDAVGELTILTPRPPLHCMAEGEKCGNVRLEK